MIIGISGRIGSGKDTVGVIIQYLTTQFNEGTNPSYEEFLKYHCPHNNTYARWEIKKYAYKLKQIVALLTGCTIEQLEDQEFKNKEIGDDWIKWEIAWSDFADTLHLNQNFWTKAIANSEKEAKDIAGNSGAFTIRYCKEVKLTYRDLLQKIGTEAMRGIIHEDIWVNALFSDYKPNYPHFAYANNKNDLRLLSDSNKENSALPNWLITDTRFPNEAKAIKDRNGIMIKVNRNINYEGKTLSTSETNTHISETALDNYNFDYIIYNDGTIEQLINIVKEFLKKEKII